MRVRRIGTHDLPTPQRQTPGSCGYSLAAVGAARVNPGITERVKTGFAWEIDAGRASGMPEIGIPTTEFGLIRDCNALGHNGAVAIGGFVDGDYRGEVEVRVVNFSEEPIYIKPGQKVAEMVIGVALIWDLEEVDAISTTDREDA
jgi:dUTP pyrophosphatase